jgi:hypothetical protein
MLTSTKCRLGAREHDSSSPYFNFLLTARSDGGTRRPQRPSKRPEAFVDKPDLADLLAQLVREEFGYVLQEKPEEPHLRERIDAVVGAPIESVAPTRIAG